MTRPGYYPRDPGPLYCWLCGISIEGPAWSKNFPPYIVLQNKEWRQAWREYRGKPLSRRREFSLCTKAFDLAATLKESQQWRTRFRIIVLSTNDKYLPRGYHLSGIGSMPGARNDEYLLVGQNPATAYLGSARENTETLRVSPVQHPFSRYMSRDSHLKDYPIHSRCWDLIELQFGSLATAQLDLVAKTIRRQWDDIIPYISHSMAWAYNFRHQQGLVKKDQLEDPLFISELNPLLHDCTESSPNHDIQEKDPLSILSSKYDPLEIKYLIAEHLSLRETFKMVMAFGEEFPVSYWKRRIPTDILFELQEFGCGSALWPFLASQIQNKGIMETYGIWNRKRILGMLKPIKQYVNTELDNEEKGKQNIEETS